MRPVWLPDYPTAIVRPAIGFRARKRGATIQSIILHSSDGREAGDINELTTHRNKSCHYYIARSRRVYQFVRESHCAFHAGLTASISWCNDRSIGIELEHLDGLESWPEDQVVEVAALITHIRRGRGPLPVLSHYAVALPKGRKIDPRGFPWSRLSFFVARASELAASEPRFQGVS